MLVCYGIISLLASKLTHSDLVSLFFAYDFLPGSQNILFISNTLEGIYTILLHCTLPAPFVSVDNLRSGMRVMVTKLKI